MPRWPFFTKPRYKTPEQLETGHDNLRYAAALIQEQIAADEALLEPPAPDCVAYADHDFEIRADGLMHCRICGDVFENPADFARELAGYEPRTADWFDEAYFEGGR